MNFTESLVYYLVLGGAVGTAYGLQNRRPGPVRRSLALLAACVFWPLYLPLVLSGRNGAADPSQPPAPCDDLALAIVQVQRELDAALTGLDGWAEGVLEQKGDRLRELRAALTAQADRIREMEALLSRERTEAAATARSAGPQAAADTNSRCQRSRQAREENMARLAGVCRQSRSDLLATLAWIRELVSMIQLARFTGAPAARAEELVAQIAAAVEGISSLSPVPEPSRGMPAPLDVDALHPRSILQRQEKKYEHLFTNP